MSYIIKESTTDKIVFARASRSGCQTSMFVVMGSFFFLIGVGFNLWGPDWEFPFSLLKILFPLFGLGAIAAGIFLPKQEKASNPQFITFDNKHGVVVIDMTDDPTQQGYIRYDEIENFAMYVESQTSQSSSTSSSSSSSILINPTLYSYHIYLNKKDGGAWYLTMSNKKAEAEEILQQLNSQVKLGKPTTIQIKPILTNKLTKEEKFDSTVISWENKVTFWAPFFLLIIGIVFLSVLLGVATSDQFKGFGFFGYIITGFMLIVFCLVMFMGFRSLLKEITTRYAVAIDKSNLEYIEYSKSTEAIKKKIVIPLKDVHSISYTFSSVKNYNTGGLEIRTHTQQSQIKNQKDEPLEMLKDAFTSKNQPVQLKINSLNPVECLQLESWLQELIKKKGNENVM